jgi:hypothetical protein
MIPSKFSKYAQFAGIAADMIKGNPGNNGRKHHMVKVMVCFISMMALLTFIPAIIDHLQKITIEPDTRPDGPGQWQRTNLC